MVENYNFHINSKEEDVESADVSIMSEQGYHPQKHLMNNNPISILNKIGEYESGKDSKVYHCKIDEPIEDIEYEPKNNNKFNFEFKYTVDTLDDELDNIINKVLNKE